MVYIPRFDDVPESKAVRRFEVEHDALARGRKTRLLEDRLTVGQMLSEAGLSEFILPLDGAQFKSASVKRRRELLMMALGMAGMVHNQDLLSMLPVKPNQAAVPPAADRTQADVSPVTAEPAPAPEPEQPTEPDDAGDVVNMSTFAG